MSVADSLRAPRVARALGWLCAATLLGAALATLVSLLMTLGTRTLDYAEGEVLFDASRIRQHLPLYFDVSRGALDYGPVPSRHFVAYVPTFAWLLALLPSSAAVPWGRFLSLLAWGGAIAWVAFRARSECRSAAIAGAVFLVGAHTLTCWAALARPDGLSVALAGIALAETVRVGRVGFGNGVLFAIAAWLKPNVVGAFAGAMAAEVIVHRALAYRAVLGVSAVTVPLAIVLQHVSSGAWIEHLLGTVWPMSWGLFFDHIKIRLPFFGVPIAVAMAAAWRGVRSQRAGAIHALAAPGTALAWTMVTLAKDGSGTNYWMEPCIAALASIAHMPLQIRPNALLAGGALGQVLWVDVASIRGSIEGYPLARAQSAFIARVRASCDGLVLADQPGLEMQLDGRILVPKQFSYLVLAKRFSVAQWVETVRAPEVRCALTTAPLPGAICAADGNGALSALQDALARRFALVEHTADLWFYTARE